MDVWSLEATERECCRGWSDEEMEERRSVRSWEVVMVSIVVVDGADLCRCRGLQRLRTLGLSGSEVLVLSRLGGREASQQ